MGGLSSRDQIMYEHRIIYPERITSAPRNLNWRIEDNTRKLTTVFLPGVKGLSEKVQKIFSSYDIWTIFTSGSTLRRYFFRVKPPTEFNMIKNCVYSIPCSSGKIYKGETGPPLKVRLEEHRKAVVRSDIEKSGKADNIWKEKGNHLPLWNKVEIIDRERWRIRRLKESAHILGYIDLLSRPNIEMNTIWKPIIKNFIYKKTRNMITGKKKSYIIVVILVNQTIEKLIPSSTSSCRVTCADFPDALLLPKSIVIAHGRSSMLHPVSVQSCCR